jgi:uncharacterized protein (TIGR02453 family)
MPTTPTHGAGFQGWPEEALAWFEGLERDNSRAWFQAHRDTYERCVRAPLEMLMAELAPAFGQASAPGQAAEVAAEAKVFRPNRDTRFSSDKSPYKTTAAATVGAFYVQVSADGLMAAAGYHHMAPDQLERYRAAAADDPGEELARLLAGYERDDLELWGEELRTAPRGYARDHPRIALLRRKGVVVGRHDPPAPWLHTPAARDRVEELWTAARPLVAWLDREVGRSELPERARP